MKAVTRVIVDELVSMGFVRALAASALEQAGGNQGAAIEILLADAMIADAT